MQAMKRVLNPFRIRIPHHPNCLPSLRPNIWIQDLFHVQDGGRPTQPKFGRTAFPQSLPTQPKFGRADLCNHFPHHNFNLHLYEMRPARRYARRHTTGQFSQQITTSMSAFNPNTFSHSNLMKGCHGTLGTRSIHQVNFGLLRPSINVKDNLSPVEWEERLGTHWPSSKREIHWSRISIPTDISRISLSQALILPQNVKDVLSFARDGRGTSIKGLPRKGKFAIDFSRTKVGDFTSPSHTAQTSY